MAGPLFTTIDGRCTSTNTFLVLSWVNQSHFAFLDELLASHGEFPNMMAKMRRRFDF